MGREFAEQTVNSIFEFTAGNPQELYQTLKFNDQELLNIVSNKNIISRYNNFEKKISLRLILELAKYNEYTLPILFCNSIINQDVSTNLLIKLVKHIVIKFYKNIFNDIRYEEGINILLDKGMLQLKRNIYEIPHDSIKELVINYLQNSSEYISYLENIIYILTEENRKKTVKFEFEILRLYSKFDTNKCFSYFVQIYSLHDSNIISGMIGIVSEIICKDLSLFNEKNLNEYIIPVILKECVFLSFYEVSYKICCIIYSIQERLNDNIRLQYFTYFVRVLIESGKFKVDDKFNAISILKDLINLDDLNPNEQFQNYLITMATYEHILDYDSINKFNNKAKQIYEKEQISIINKAKYLRNQSLVKAHRNLENTYKQAIIYAKQIMESREKMLILGTCYNHLGLCYLYSGKILTAYETFQKSLIYLENIGYDTFRVINNLAVCALLSNNLDSAYEYILQAKVLNLSCVFEKLCIQNNLAIIEWKLGHFDMAEELVQNLVEQYKTGMKETDDELVYCSALINLGYFLYSKGDYLGSGKAYNDSLFFKYRYDNELQEKKRKSMINLCLYRLGILKDQPKGIDIDDNITNIFLKQYAPIALAYNVI